MVFNVFWTKLEISRDFEVPRQRRTNTSRNTVFVLECRLLLAFQRRPRKPKTTAKEAPKDAQEDTYKRTGMPDESPMDPKWAKMGPKKAFGYQKSADPSVAC